MKNHTQAIDDGLDEYQELLDRQTDEAAFRAQPHMFNGVWCASSDGEAFRCSRVQSLVLQAPKQDRKRGPFAYDGGHAVLFGQFTGRGPTWVHLWWNGGQVDFDVLAPQ